MSEPPARLLHLGIFNILVVISNQTQGMDHTSGLPQLHSLAVLHTRVPPQQLLVPLLNDITRKLSVPAPLLEPSGPDGTLQHEAPQAHSENCTPQRTLSVLFLLMISSTKEW